MPLFRRQPFQRLKPPPDLKPDDEVFICPLTKEIFRDYDAFFERVILCNSLVWSCALTGKANLTYQEALESEQKAIRCIIDIPRETKIPMLYLANRTCRGKLHDVADDVYFFIKDRYFLSESVEAIIDGKWHRCEVTRIIPPSKEAMDNYIEEPDEDLSKEDKIANRDQFGYPPELLKYEVQPEASGSSKKTSESHVVATDCIRREKGVLSRDKTRIYVKHVMEFCDQGCWIVKDGALAKYKIPVLKYEQIFVGKPPTFDGTPQMKKPKETTATPPVKKNKNTASGQAETTPSSSNGVGLNSSKTSKESPAVKGEPKAKKKSENANDIDAEMIQIRENREKFREEMKLAAEKQKAQKLEEKKQARLKRKEEKRAQVEYLREWNKPRDDLECDDLKDMPTPIPVHCPIPNHLFGDFMMLLEFFACFDTELHLKDDFPGGVSYELLERAVTEKEVAGPLSEILQIMLKVIFDLQEEEAEEVSQTKIASEDADGVEAGVETQDKDTPLLQSQSYTVTSLSKITLDALTVTEVLRLHLLSAPVRNASSDLNAKWRYQQRGGYTNADDPAFQFRTEEPQIIRALASTSVYSLSMSDKLKILNVLANQILTYVSIRDTIDDKAVKLQTFRHELKQMQISEKKRFKEEKSRNRLKNEDEVVTGDQAKMSAEQKEASRLTQEKEEARRRQEVAKKEKQLFQNIAKILPGVHILPLGLDRAHRRFWSFTSLPGLFVEHDDEFVGPCLPAPTPLAPPPSKATAAQGDIRQYFKSEPGKEPEKDAEGAGEEEKKPKIFGMCNGDMNTCPVHTTYLPKTKWAFYDQPEDLDRLLAALNDRGYRESALKQVLLQDKERIVETIKQCPAFRLNESKEPNLAGEARKSSRQQKKEREYDVNLNFPPGTPVDEVLELTLRDMILETEEKVSMGGLGNLKVKSRVEWREAIEARGYDQQCESIKWAGKVRTASPQKISPSASPMEDEESLAEKNRKKAIRDLASAILQIAQSVELKYLQEPLGQSEKQKKKKDTKKQEEASSATVETKSKAAQTAMERWEASLYGCTSFAQLYVHLTALDNSIMWSRSSMNARCRICRRKGDPEKMLLCDDCNKGHHMYCLKPPLKNVPEGDWFCNDCRPKEKPKTPRKFRRVFYEESDEDEPEQDAEEEEEVQDEEASETESVHQETCAVCSKGGHVICCDVCPRVYHLGCMNPPLKKVPRGKWECPECKAPDSTKTKPKTTVEKKEAARVRQALKYSDDDEDMDSEELEEEEDSSKKTPSVGIVVLGKRRSATQAVDKIALAAKRLKSEAWEDSAASPGNGSALSNAEDSDSGEQSRRSSRPSRHSHGTRSLNGSLNVSNTSLNTSANSRARRGVRIESANGHAGDKQVLDMTVMETLIGDMVKHPDAWPFIRPVKKSEAPDYFTIIKRPMDLGTVKYKLQSLQYPSNAKMIEDIYLVFDNCEVYNKEETDEYKCGISLRNFFAKRAKELKIDIDVRSGEDEAPPTKKAKA